MSTETARTEGTTDNLPSITWTLTIDGEQIGSLIAHTSGLILNVEIDEEHRGEGHARRLYENADITLLHVPTWGRTHEGNAFAEAMGGEVMDDETACEILDLDLAIVTGAAFI